MTIKDLNSAEFDEYYARYINKLPTTLELRTGFLSGKESTKKFFRAIPEEKLAYRYAPDKWTVKEVLQHLIDTERIFAYRMFRIARRDKTPLAPFSQNIYIQPSGANKKGIDQLLDEYEKVRNGTIALIESLSDEDFCEVGVSSNVPMSARAAAFTIIGHDIWHTQIINERYL